MLVTGGAKRIGAAIARAFASAGWHIVIHYGRSQAQAEALATELPSAEIVSCDLGEWTDSRAMIVPLEERLDDWRLLINCAGVFVLDTAPDLKPDDLDTEMRVNAGQPDR